MAGKTSSYKGVSAVKNGKKIRWRAKVRFRGKSYSAGTYATELEAALAANEQLVRLGHKEEELDSVLAIYEEREYGAALLGKFPTMQSAEIAYETYTDAVDGMLLLAGISLSDPKN